MSSRRRTLVLTGPAQRNLRSILAHSETTWGSSQADEYESVIARAFEMLVEHPELGKSAGEGRPGWRILVVQRHCIVYRYSDTTVWILRILHKRMDVSARLKDVAG
jgi:toxin ParE1/3/4